MRDSEEDGKPGEEVSKNGTEFHGPMPPIHVAHSETESQWCLIWSQGNLVLVALGSGYLSQLLVLRLSFQHAF